MKNTETWVLRYAISTTNNASKPVSASTYDYASGKNIHLLATGQEIARNIIDGERLMPIFLFEEFFDMVKINGTNQIVKKRYLQKTFEVAKDKSTETDEQSMARKTVEFLKKHYEISHKDIKGTQLNKNFPVASKIYYELINLDAIESEIAQNEIMTSSLLEDVIVMKREDPNELNNLAFGVGINPTGLSEDKVFNMIRAIIEKDPKAFENFLRNDTDRYEKTVVNKALRTEKGEEGFNYVVQGEDGMYRMGGQVLSDTFDGLILYFKQNAEMLAYLEKELGFKKKQQSVAK